jgi:hypothetical protein
MEMGIVKEEKQTREKRGAEDDIDSMFKGVFSLQLGQQVPTKR